MRPAIAAALAAAFLAAGITGSRAETCVASWYSHGVRTANGEHFRPSGMTAAHLTLPFGSRLMVHHGRKAVVVRINDRGPFVRGRCLDLSRGAATALGFRAAGTGVITFNRIR